MAPSLQGFQAYCRCRRSDRGIVRLRRIINCYAYPVPSE
jgi:hypothetical protein